MWAYLFVSLLVTYLGAKWLGSMVGVYLTLKILPNCFGSRCAVLYCYHQCVRVTVSPHNCEDWVCSVFLILASMCVVEPHCGFTLCCYAFATMRTNDVGHLFMYLLAIYIFSLVESPLYHFESQEFSIYFEWSSLSDRCVVNVFYQCCICSLFSYWCLIEEQKF